MPDCQIARLAWAHRAKHLTMQAKCDPIEYLHDEIGYNYRLVNLLAALGYAQMEQLDAFVERKKEIAGRYRRAFEKYVGIRCMESSEWAESVDWLFTIFLESEGCCSRQALLDGLYNRRIQTRPLWRPVHRLPMYADAPHYRIEVANRLYEGCLSLPCSVALSSGDQQRVVKAVGEICDSKG